MKDGEALASAAVAVEQVRHHLRQNFVCTTASCGSGNRISGDAMCSGKSCCVTRQQLKVDLVHALCYWGTKDSAGHQGRNDDRRIGLYDADATQALSRVRAHLTLTDLDAWCARLRTRHAPKWYGQLPSSHVQPVTRSLAARRHAQATPAALQLGPQRECPSSHLRRRGPLRCCLQAAHSRQKGCVVACLALLVHPPGARSTYAWPHRERSDPASTANGQHVSAVTGYTSVRSVSW